jgi:hypothetical protein
MGLPPTTNSGCRAYNIALGGACTNANPMTMLYGPRTLLSSKTILGLAWWAYLWMEGLTKPPLVA